MSPEAGGTHWALLLPRIADSKCCRCWLATSCCHPNHCRLMRTDVGRELGLAPTLEDVCWAHDIVTTLQFGRVSA